MDESTILGLARGLGLNVANARAHQSLGIDNHVWFLDDDLVLRTPRNLESARYMEGEIGIWQFVQAKGLRVPELVGHGMREEGLPFMIVRRVEGRLIGETGRGADLSMFIEDLVEQMELLHSLPVEDKSDWRRPFDDFDPWPYFRQAWDKGALPKSDLLEIEDLYQRLASYPGNYRSSGDRERQPVGGVVLTHNDMHAWNLLVAGDPPRLSSIIDWGDACVSDRRNDLSTMPLDLQIQIAEAYRQRVGEVGEGFEARVLWAWLDISFWEVMNMETMGFHRPWWRWPIGGWARVKEILRAAPEAWRV